MTGRRKKVIVGRGGMKEGSLLKEEKMELQEFPQNQQEYIIKFFFLSVST